MKKYLIAGALALVCNGLFTSCSEDMGNYSSPEEAKKAQFAQNFEKFYGTPNPNQDWGFGDASLTRAKARTRGVNVNGNLWYQNWERPVNVTTDEASKVLTAFSIKRENQTNNITINWDNYWVHQVHQSNNTYLNGYGQNTGDIHTKMNKIIAYNTSGGSYYYEHVYNFNDGNNNTPYTDDITKQQYVGTTLMVDMGTRASATNQFGYHNTLDSKDHFEYFIIAGSDIDASLAGYYYVGFDFCASHPDGQEANKNMDVNRDWVYNDWIVRISPATPIESNSSTGGNISSNTDGTEVYTKQHVLVHKWVFCEDLGSSSNRQDYDYNDLVFDARIVDEYKVIKNADGTESPYSGDTSHRYYAKLTPLAAGGEYVMWFDQNNQPIHGLFVPSTANNVLINTCKSDQKISLSHMEGLPAQTIIYTFNSEEEATINNITIFVRSATATYDITAIPGEAPNKICVPPGTRWPYERTDIKDAYTGFTKYVEERIDPWDDGVEANLYPLDNVPDSLKTDQFNQYTTIKDSDNSTENTTYSVSLTDSETPIWSGENDFADWNGNNAARIEASKFSKVGEGTVIRFYGVANSAFNVKAIYADSWADIDLGDSRWITNNEKCNYGNSSLHSYIELKLNATTAENFKSKGMLVYGNQFKLLCVSYDNTNKKSSEEEPYKTVTPSNTETDLLNGAVNMGDWMDKHFNSGLSGVGNGTKIRIYGYPTGNSYQVNFQDRYNNHSLVNDGAVQNNSKSFTQDGYIEYTINETIANSIKAGGFHVTGQYFYLRYVTIDNTNVVSESETNVSDKETILVDQAYVIENSPWLNPVSGSSFSGCKNGSILRIYGKPTNDSNWQLILKTTHSTDLSFNNHKTNSFSNNNNPIVNGVITLELTADCVTNLINQGGLITTGNNFKVNKITIQK